MQNNLESYPRRIKVVFTIVKMLRTIFSTRHPGCHILNLPPSPFLSLSDTAGAVATHRYLFAERHGPGAAG